MKTIRLEAVHEGTIWGAGLKCVGGGTEGAGEEGCVYTAFKYKCTENHWAAGRAAQKLQGRAAETWLGMEGACVGRLRLTGAEICLALEACPSARGSRGLWWQFCPSPLLYLGVFWANWCQQWGSEKVEMWLSRERCQPSQLVLGALTWKLLCLHDTKW